MSTHLFAALILAAGMAAAQQATTPPPEWQYAKQDDLLHAKVNDQFVLEGVYLTPPRTLVHTPSIVVQCSNGKVERNYFNVGAVVDKEGENSLGMPLISGFEVRIDGKKKGLLVDGISTDLEGLFFTRIDLKNVLNAKQVVVGVNEFMGPQVVMRFEMPNPAPVMDKCGSDKMLRPTDRWGRPIKKRVE